MNENWIDELKVSFTTADISDCIVVAMLAAAASTDELKVFVQNVCAGLQSTSTMTTSSVDNTAASSVTTDSQLNYGEPA
jgi:hypothetical protein